MFRAQIRLLQLTCEQYLYFLYIKNVKTESCIKPSFAINRHVDVLPRKSGTFKFIFLKTTISHETEYVLGLSIGALGSIFSRFAPDLNKLTLDQSQFLFRKNILK